MADPRRRRAPAFARRRPALHQPGLRHPRRRLRRQQRLRPDYRKRLEGEWGVVDVDDCVNGAAWLVERGLADGDKLAIRGGSASGYTTLCAVTFRDRFKAGTSYFGIGDLETFDTQTHKFESRYTGSLVGPYPEAKQLYHDRSPLNFVERISCPVLILQGAEDRIVPPAQAEQIVDALWERHLPHAYLLFPGRGSRLPLRGEHHPLLRGRAVVLRPGLRFRAGRPHRANRNRVPRRRDRAPTRRFGGGASRVPRGQPERVTVALPLALTPVLAGLWAPTVPVSSSEVAASRSIEVVLALLIAATILAVVARRLAVPVPGTARPRRPGDRIHPRAADRRAGARRRVRPLPAADPVLRGLLHLDSRSPRELRPRHVAGRRPRPVHDARRGGRRARPRSRRSGGRPHWHSGRSSRRQTRSRRRPSSSASACPRRIVAILEGESLLNDATALVAYRVAVGAAMLGAFSVFDAGSTLHRRRGGWRGRWVDRRLPDHPVRAPRRRPGVLRGGDVRRPAGGLPAGPAAGGVRESLPRSPPGSMSAGTRRGS